MHPDDLQSLGRPAKPLHDEVRTQRQLPLRPVCAVPRDKVARLHASSGNGKSVVVGIARSRGRSLRAAGVRAGDMLPNNVTATACSPAAPAPTTASSVLAAIATMSGGQTEKQVQQIMDFPPRRVRGHAVPLSLVIAEEFERLNISRDISAEDPASSAPEPQLSMRSRSSASSASTPSTSTASHEVMGPGGQRVHRDQGRPGDWGRPTSSRDHRSRHRRSARRRGRLSIISTRSPAFPVIRYRTRDHRLAAADPRSFRRIGKITGARTTC